MYVMKNAKYQREFERIYGRFILNPKRTYICGVVAVRTWMANEAIACWIAGSTKTEKQIELFYA
jgi:hypothetical protein